ncbi:MAG TPA: alkaline shock response membrane anchor protein AmaP [Clostridiaceae bacterium]|nr:alkaline shock response membrane anchor protein AmaP [Clostridiaceae bacterium]
MNRVNRFFIIAFSFILAVIFIVLLLMMSSEVILKGMIETIIDVAQKQPYRTIIMIVCLVMALVSLATMVVTILTSRMRRQRVRANEIGTIDIGVDAIENIALNAAKASQSGVKSAKAWVSPYKGDKIAISMNVMTYSDVELPLMMSRLQERVKKDVEKYTGIEVSDVQVKVNRVEAITARVER